MIQIVTLCLLASLCSSRFSGVYHGSNHGRGFLDDWYGRDYYDNNHHGSHGHREHDGYGTHGFGYGGHNVHDHSRDGYDSGNHHKGRAYSAPVKYDYGYGVNDPYHGTSFGHKESRDGHLTTGEYYVDLPDGRLQKVSYYADEHGYHPTITYTGKARYPSYGKGHAGRYY